MTLSLLVLTLGCTSQGDRVDDTGTTKTTPTGQDDTGTTTITGTGDIEDITVSPSAAMSTVITVEFATTEAATCQVVLGPSAGEYRYATAADPAPVTEHAFIVPGFPVETEYHWRVECTFAEGTGHSNDATYTAGSAPGSLPDFEVEDVDLTQNALGYRIIPWTGETDGGFLVLNAEGQLVWWLQTDTGQVALSVHQDAAGQGVYWNINDIGRRKDISSIEYARWDLTGTQSMRTEWGHHDYTVLPDGAGFAYIMADIREADGETVVGDAIWRMDADGSNPREIWNAWDEIPQPNFRGCHVTFYPFACDWTHVNTIAYEPAEDAYYISIHEYNSVARLSGMEDGTTDWYLGELDPIDYAPATEDDVFRHQHGVKAWPGLPDTLVLFDNGEGNPGDTSRAIRVTHDGTDGYEVTWEFDFGDRYSSILLGDADPVGDQLNTLMSWGSEGIVNEVTESKESVFRFNFNLGAASAFVEWLPTMGGPI